LQSRVLRAVQSLQRHTVDTFVTRYMEALEARNLKLRGFSRLVTHELRQPLNVLHLLTQVISDSPSAGLPAQILQMLDRNTRRLTQIVDKLEQVARIDAADDSPVVQEADLGDLARDAADQLSEMAEARGVQLQIERLPRLNAEPARMTLVFVNLLANAIKYSDPDKSAREIVIREASTADEWRVEVSDNGIGIPRARLEQVFHAFVRVHAHRDAELNANGLGLGLSIVRECMDAMNGRVDVRSTEQQGTTVVLCWPREQLPAANPA